MYINMCVCACVSVFMYECQFMYVWICVCVLEKMVNLGKFMEGVEDKRKAETKEKIMKKNKEYNRHL